MILLSNYKLRYAVLCVVFIGSLMEIFVHTKSILAMHSKGMRIRREAGELKKQTNLLNKRTQAILNPNTRNEAMFELARIIGYVDANYEEITYLPPSPRQNKISKK